MNNSAELIRRLSDVIFSQVNNLRATDRAVAQTQIVNSAAALSTIPDKVYIDDADLVNGWANSAVSGEPQLSICKDRKSVRMRGNITNGAATTATITTLAVDYRPDERSYGFLVNAATNAVIPIAVATTGVLTYLGSGTTDLSGGALVFLDYRTAS